MNHFWDHSLADFAPLFYFRFKGSCFTGKFQDYNAVCGSQVKRKYF